MMMSERNSSRYPFTASQWQELAHQALIFKYMASGQPIPSDLILPIRTSFFLNSSSTTSTAPPFHHQPNIGRGCFQMGFDRKTEDPEPGRCRRTDGKKWRCSKEAYPDSKYCERHMHRGKNRSRKHVEMSLTNNPTSTTSPYTTSLYPSLSIAAPETQYLMYPYSSSSSPPGIGLSLQNNTTHFHLGTGSSSPDKDNRYFLGLKNGVNEYTSFSHAPETKRDGTWHLTQLGMSSLSESKQRDSYSHLTDLSKEKGEEKRQHCFVLGADFKLERPVKVEREEKSHKPLHSFFDEWPLKIRESWVDMEDRSNWAPFSKTQLSISIPMAHHEFPIASSRSHNNG